MSVLNGDQDDPRAQRATHASATPSGSNSEEEWTSPLDLPEDFIRTVFEGWNVLEEEILRLNAAKREIFERCRKLHGKYHTDALKLACKFARLEDSKVAGDQLIVKQAHRYWRVIKQYPQSGVPGNA